MVCGLVRRILKSINRTLLSAAGRGVVLTSKIAVRLARKDVPYYY